MKRSSAAAEEIVSRGCGADLSQAAGVGSCTLRDTFFGHPVSVYPGPSETLAHRAQVRGGPRPTRRAVKCAGANTAARRRGPKRSPSARLPAPRSAGASCALRHTFFGHPVSVYPGPSETLAHRAQVRGRRRRSGCRHTGEEPCEDPCKAAYANAASSRLRVMRQPMEYGVIRVPFISWALAWHPPEHMYLAQQSRQALLA